GRLLRPRMRYDGDGTGRGILRPAILRDDRGRGQTVPGDCMMSDHTHKPIEFPEDREAFLRWAVEVDDESVEVGRLTRGTAARARHACSAGPLARSRFLELSRSQRGLNLEQ